MKNRSHAEIQDVLKRAHEALDNPRIDEFTKIRIQMQLDRMRINAEQFAAEIAPVVAWFEQCIDDCDCPGCDS